MARTETTRLKYERKSLRYHSDVTDAEWTLIAPHLRGQSRKWSLREVINAILYLLRTGCQSLPGRRMKHSLSIRIGMAASRPFQLKCRENLGPVSASYRPVSFDWTSTRPEALVSLRGG